VRRAELLELLRDLADSLRIDDAGAVIRGLVAVELAPRAPEDRITEDGVLAAI